MRPRELFVHELSSEEGARLKSMSKGAKYQPKRHGAMIVFASPTGVPAPETAGAVRSDESHVRELSTRFNERGFASLDPIGAG
jgi:hypothetical protein